MKRKLVMMVFYASLTLLVFVGIILELCGFTKTMKGTFVIRPPDMEVKNPAGGLPRYSYKVYSYKNKECMWMELKSSTVLLTEDIFRKVEGRQKTRKQKLDKYCLEHADQNPIPKRHQLGHLLIDDDNKFIYCAIAKVASTTMLRMLLSLKNNSHKFVHNLRLWKHMSQLNASESPKRLETHFKFLFVREPFHRLLSAYRDKFFGKNRFYTNKYRQMIVSAYRPQDVEKVATKTNNVTFTEFLKYIVTSSNHVARNPHWRKYQQLCFPCNFKFDFIGHFETLAEDAAYMLKKAGIDDRVAFPPIRSSRAESDFLTYYSQVPREIIFKVKEVFKSDFEMFGYPLPGLLMSLLGNYTKE